MKTSLLNKSAIRNASLLKSWAADSRVTFEMFKDSLRSSSLLMICSFFDAALLTSMPISVLNPDFQYPSSDSIFKINIYLVDGSIEFFQTKFQRELIPKDPNSFNQIVYNECAFDNFCSDSLGSSSGRTSLHNCSVDVFHSNTSPMHVSIRDCAITDLNASIDFFQKASYTWKEVPSRLIAKDDLEERNKWLALMANLKENGLSENLSDVSVAYLDKYQNNFIYSFFNGYGYKKERAITATLWILLIIILINIFFFPKIHYEVYEIENFPDRKSKYRIVRDFSWHYFTHLIIYTAVVFFTLRLNHSKMKYDKMGYLLYFVVIYVLGLVCLGYLVNLVISSSGGQGGSKIACFICFCHAWHPERRPFSRVFTAL